MAEQMGPGEPNRPQLGQEAQAPGPDGRLEGGWTVSASGSDSKGGEIVELQKGEVKKTASPEEFVAWQQQPEIPSAAESPLADYQSGAEQLEDKAA